MLLKNESRRLIQINSKQKLQHRKGEVVGAKAGKKILLKPAGKPEDIPDHMVVLNHRFIRELIKLGDLKGDLDELADIIATHDGVDVPVSEDDQGETDDEPNPYKGCSRADLVMMAEGLGIDVPKAMTMPKIIEAIEAAG